MTLTVDLIGNYLNPHQLIYMAMHTDYSEDGISKAIEAGKIPSEDECETIIIKRLLAGNRGHYGCLEHIPILFYITGIYEKCFDDIRSKPGICLRIYPSRSDIIYLKLNLRSWLSLMDYKVKYPDNELSPVLDKLWLIGTWLFPKISEWYVNQRMPLLQRKQQTHF